MTSTPCAEGIEVIMFRTIGDGPSAWELLLPPELLRLPPELARVDGLRWIRVHKDPSLAIRFWGMKRCAPRSAIRSAGGGFAGSGWMGGCPIPRR